jgi:hypothetical protein
MARFMAFLRAGRSMVTATIPSSTDRERNPVLKSS